MLKRIIISTIIFCTIVLLLYLSQYNYILFHYLAELFAITVAWSVFILMWNTRTYAKNLRLLLLSISYLFIGGIDLLHTLSYKGANIFHMNNTANMATQFWIIGRALEAIALLLYSMMSQMEQHQKYVQLCYGILFTVIPFLIIAVFIRQFPDCYIEEKGLTVFKISSEYCICLVLLMSMFFFKKNNQQMNRTVYMSLQLAVSITILAELSFTLYTDVYGLFNMIGHLLKILSYFFVFKAIIHTGLNAPYAVLFQDLSIERALLQSIFDASPDFLVFKDRQSVYQKVNTSFSQFVGRQSEWIVGKTDNELFPEEDADQYSTGDANVMENDIQESEEWHVKGKKGRRWFQVLKTPVKDHLGVIMGVLCTARDITDRRLSEKFLIQIAERERHKLGQSLHDGLCQDLKSIEIELALLENQLIDQNQSEASLVQDIGKGINLAIKNAYALTSDMISDNIKAKTFPRMLQEMAFRLHNYSKSNCDLILNISHISPSDQYHAHHLYYIAREALHNALKHSNAQEIKIEWAIIDNHPSMMIIDNGCGIKKPFKGGLGIKIMKSRARMMNADFNIKSTQEGGTIVSCCS